MSEPTIIRRTLFRGELMEIAHVAARPASTACGGVEVQPCDVIVLPLAGVFAKHDGPRRQVIATANHAVLVAADRPYRISFPGAIGDRCLTLRQRNHICEAGYPPERAAVVLRHPGSIIAAFEGDELVGIIRVLCDGLAAAIMEFSVELRLQGPTEHGNGSLIEGDQAGLAGQLGRAMLAELAAREIDFISYDLVEGAEQAFFEALGFQRNVGMINYVVDRRPYVSRTVKS